MNNFTTQEARELMADVGLLTAAIAKHHRSVPNEILEMADRIARFTMPAVIAGLCPHGCELHFHHGGCPCCDMTPDEIAEAFKPECRAAAEESCPDCNGTGTVVESVEQGASFQSPCPTCT